MKNAQYFENTVHFNAFICIFCAIIVHFFKKCLYQQKHYIFHHIYNLILHNLNLVQEFLIQLIYRLG